MATVYVTMSDEFKSAVEDYAKTLDVSVNEAARIALAKSIGFDLESERAVKEAAAKAKEAEKAKRQEIRSKVNELMKSGDFDKITRLLDKLAS